jgi:hypothetical protein
MDMMMEMVAVMQWFSSPQMKWILELCVTISAAS